VILQGSLGADRNFVSYLVQRSTASPQVDLYGRLPDQDRACAILRDRKAAREHGLRYQGLLDNRGLAARRREYAWSLVSWNPDSFDTLHACPNKFFESIADGVPPIAGPHPQCREVIETYDCGILLQDWSLGAFEEGLREAEAVFGTERYQRLVENCRRAHQTELCWEKQFAKLRPFLPPAGRRRSRGRRPKFILLDPTLKSEVGHHYHYAQHVLAGSRELGAQAVAGTNRQLTVTLDAAERLYPVYWYDFWGRNLGLPNLPRGRRTSAHFLRQTRLVLDAEGAGTADQVFIPNISDEDLAALSRFLVTALREPGPRWHLFLRHDVPQEDGTRVRALRSLSRYRDRVCCWTDTEELAAQHREAAGVEVGVLPIPVSLHPVPEPPRRRGGLLRVGYLGDARREKGYTWLPEVIRAVQHLTTSDRLAFTIQTVTNGADADCDRVTAELGSLPLGPGGRLLPQRLSTAEYEALLDEMDVVLALYEPVAYRRRSSHVVVEALCRGKAVLLTEGTAPARLLPPEAGWTCHGAEEAGRVLARLAEQVSDRSGLLATTRREELAAFHCGRRLAEMLLSA
jgi:glycosyltransferase involved in cell wall biosynthesis